MKWVPLEMESERTYMPKKIMMVIRMIKSPVLPATYNLQYQNSKAKYIWFCWEKAIYCILWRHVTTETEYNKLWIFYRKNREMQMLMDPYYVPTTLFVLTSFSLPPKILAMPKSDIFGFMSISNKMLPALRSLWMIVNRESWWR